MKREFSAGVVVYRQTEKHRYYLILRYGAGHWDFPKGHIENNETKQEAALRELKEETGLKVSLESNFEHTFTYFFKQSKTHELILKEVYFFIAHTTRKTVRLSFEHTDFAWLSYEDALAQLTYKNAKELLVAVETWLNKQH